MKRIIKSAAAVLVICTILTSLAGCRFGIQLEPTPYGANNMELYTIAAFSIPYADKPGTKIESIEKDAYGRVLFRVRFKTMVLYFQNEPRNEQMFAYVVCQKSDRKRTYYYEDDCFRLYLTDAMFTESEQTELKEINDWGKPLNEEKMTSRQIIKKAKNKLNATVLGLDKGLDVSLWLGEAFLKLHPLDKQYIDKVYLDCDSAGNSLGLVWGYQRNDNDEVELEAYFVMVKKDGLTIKDAKLAAVNGVQIQEISDTLHFQEELKQFKADNNWES